MYPFLKFGAPATSDERSRRELPDGAAPELGTSLRIQPGRDARGAAIHPHKEDLGSSDTKLLAHWKRYAFGVVDGKIRMSVTGDPEELRGIDHDTGQHRASQVSIQQLRLAL